MDPLERVVDAANKLVRGDVATRFGAALAAIRVPDGAGEAFSKSWRMGEGMRPRTPEENELTRIDIDARIPIAALELQNGARSLANATEHEQLAAVGVLRASSEKLTTTTTAMLKTVQDESLEVTRTVAVRIQELEKTLADLRRQLAEFQQQAGVAIQVGEEVAGHAATAAAAVEEVVRSAGQI